MSGFFWNIRGFDFGCLIETKVKESRAEGIMKSVFQDWSFMSNYEDHRLGRLWFVWKSNVRVTPIYKTSQIITCSIYLEGRNEEFFCLFYLCLKFHDGTQDHVE